MNAFRHLLMLCLLLPFVAAAAPAEDLVTTGVVAVLNTEPSSDDRYPNRGPLILAEAVIACRSAEGVTRLYRKLA